MRQIWRYIEEVSRTQFDEFFIVLTKINSHMSAEYISSGLGFSMMVCTRIFSWGNDNATLPKVRTSHSGHLLAYYLFDS